MDNNLLKSFEPVGDHNPIMTQRFGADPFAMIYKDRVYMYMTCDILTYDEAGKLTENTYSTTGLFDVKA